MGARTAATHGVKYVDFFFACPASLAHCFIKVTEGIIELFIKAFKAVTAAFHSALITRGPWQRFPGSGAG